MPWVGRPWVWSVSVARNIWGLDLGICIDRVSSLALLARETPGKTKFDDVNSEFATVSQKIMPSLLGKLNIDYVGD